MARPGDSERPGGPAPVEAAVSAPVEDSVPAHAGFWASRGWRAVPFLDVPGAVPANRGDGGVWVFYAVLGWVGGQIAAFILIAVVAAVLGDSGQLTRLAHLAEPPEWYIATSLVGLWIGFAAGPWLASQFRGTKHFVADLGLRFRWIDLAGVVIGVACQFIVTLCYQPFIKTVSKFEAPTQKLTGASHGGGFFLVAVLTVIGAPFFEELLFRGLLFKGLARAFSPTALGPSRRRALAVGGAIVVDGLAFGLAHAEWEQLPGLACFGMLLAFLSFRTNRLGMNMVAHASFNCVAIVLAYNSGVLFR